MKIFLIFLNILFVCLASNRWPKHDISTLKLLQVIHRHGDRTPTDTVPNDPYKNESFWPQGLGQLTEKGKYRMYKLGQFIRQEYGSYLGNNYSPREVYARSSLADRCIESASCLLSGAYPPNQKQWKWSEGSDTQLGNIWQPFPIQTFMPQIDDLVLNTAKECPVVDNEVVKIYNRSEIQKFELEHKQFYANISKIMGLPIDNMLAGALVYDILQIELDHNYIWKDVWTETQMKQISDKLFEIHLMLFRYLWDSPIIHRLRAGGLVMELNKNIQKVLDKQNDKKLIVYSTHDSQLGVLMHSLNIYDNSNIPFGATLFFELHQKHQLTEKNEQEYFIRIYYHNETVIDSGVPHPMRLNDCPIYEYFNSTKHLFYENFDKECKI